MLSRISRGWALSVSLGVLLVAIYLIKFSQQVPFSVDYIRANFGVAVPDVRFAFSPSETHAALTELGETGRRSYTGFRVADLIFLSVYAVVLSGLIFRLFGARRLVWLPVATAVFDVLEDIGLFVALSEYPAPSSTVLTLASVAGVLKFFGVGLTMLVIGGGLVYQAARFLRGRRSEHVPG